MLSLNLAIFNALPIPMLDGGRMFFVFLEIVRGGRRISPEKEGLVHFAGFALMMVGVLIVTYFDIARLVT
ncbi:MAG: site-2 protease family protein [Dehalococcoidia bacterium]|nr:site-2 protease family protein [Dehalococcoidia bacterium]